MPDTEQGEQHQSPAHIAGTSAVLFMSTDGTPQRDGQLAVLDLDTGEVTRLGLAGISPQYVSTGHLVYAASDGAVRAVGFDVSSFTVTGSPVILIEGVGLKGFGAANFSVSDSGRLVYALGTGTFSDRSLVWLDHEGQAEPTPAPPREYSAFSLSPDGTRAAARLADDSGNIDIWVSDLARGTLTRVTTDPAADVRPLWGPDGSRVAFQSNRNGRPELFWKSADGSGTAELLVTIDESSGGVTGNDWSPDGTMLFAAVTSPETRQDIGMVSLDDPGSWQPLVQTAASERGPTISPNGRWLAYESDETGRSEVYLQRFPEMDNRRPISVGGGRSPMWSQDGGTLFYQGGPSGAAPETVMQVSITGDADAPAALEVGTPERLFDWRYFATGGGRRYLDYSAEDQRFLAISLGDLANGEAPAPEIHVVLNWGEELKARVPVP